MQNLVRAKDKELEARAKKVCELPSTSSLCVRHHNQLADAALQVFKDNRKACVSEDPKDCGAPFASQVAEAEAVLARNGELENLVKELGKALEDAHAENRTLVNVSVQRTAVPSLLPDVPQMSAHAQCQRLPMVLSVLVCQPRHSNCIALCILLEVKSARRISNF